MSVQKLDNDVIFNSLVTNIKTEQELKDAGTKIVNTYYKNFKNKLKINSNGMLDWIPENIDKLLKICNSGNKLSSIRIMSEALSNLLLLINKNNSSFVILFESNKSIIIVINLSLSVKDDKLII